MWYNGSTVKENKMKARSALYVLAQILGDANAVSNKSIGKRIARRSLGRVAGKSVLRRLVKRSK